MDNHGNYIQPISPAGTNPVWCHDGEHILFQGGYTYVLSIDIYGNNEKVVYQSADSLKFKLYDVSQSGEWLLGSEFMVYENEEGKAADTDDEILLININTGEKKYLTENDKEEGAPKFSPDESLIAFTRIDYISAGSRQILNLYVMNADGSGVIKLTDFSYNRGTISKAWSPDGKKIAFDNAERNLSFRPKADIFILDIDTGVIINITNTAKNIIENTLMDWE